MLQIFNILRHFFSNALFYKQGFFSTQPQCCLTFSWIEFQMLLRCCLIHITIIILRHILCLVCLCPFLGLGLFMSYLCDLLFIFSLIFIVINHITSIKQTYLFFLHFLEYLHYFCMITWVKKVNNFQIAKFSLRVLLSFSLIFFLSISALRCIWKSCL